MGADKAHVGVGTKTMLDHVVSALSAVTGEVVVVGRTETFPGTSTLPDAGTPHRGPLAGVAAAVEAFPASLLVVVAVDQPWVRPATLERLVELDGRLPVVPVDGGVRQTTCAVYPTDALEGIRDELDGGGSIQSLLDRTSFRPVIETEWRSWSEDGRSWFSADSTTDIENGLERFGAP